MTDTSPASAPPEVVIPDDVRKKLLSQAETLWADLQANKLGGFSGINRPFWILQTLREVWREGRNAALAESRAEVARLKDAFEWYCRPAPDDARPRSPTATGEEREIAERLAGRIGFEAHEGEATSFENAVAIAEQTIAAARAQGEREERERVMHILTVWLPALTAAGQGHSLSAIIDEVRALTPEPQEDKL